MKLKWSEERIGYFSDPIKTAERKTDWVRIIIYLVTVLFLFGIIKALI